MGKSLRFSSNYVDLRKPFSPFLRPQTVTKKVVLGRLPVLGTITLSFLTVVPFGGPSWEVGFELRMPTTGRL